MSAMKQWHFFDKVYRRWVVLMIGSLKEFRSELEANGYKELEHIIEAKGMCVELMPENNTANQNCTIVWLNGYETATLVHELTHLVMMNFDQVGLSISRDNTEGFAFYMEFWFNEMMRARKKYPNGRTPKQARAHT